MEGGGDVLKIRHGAHVDPGLGHGDDDIGVAEAQGGEDFDLGGGVGELLAHEVLARDAHMGGAGGQLLHDLGGREKGHLDARQFRQRAAIVARAASLHHREARALEEVVGVLLQSPLGRDGENEGLGVVAHALSPPAKSRSHQMAAPTAGMS